MLTGIGLILSGTAGYGAGRAVIEVCKSVAPTGMSYVKALTYSAGVMGLATVASNTVQSNIRKDFEKIEEDRQELINSL